MTELVLLVVVVLTALAFDFTNGFHDTANAMATSIATRALKPRTAVALAAVLNLVGAFLSVQVALTVTNDVLRIQGEDGAPVPGLMGTPILEILLAGLVGAILWNLATWYLGLPSSSSHAMFGGLIGAALVAVGVSGVQWVGVLEDVVIPALVAPFVAMLVAALGIWCVLRLTARVPGRAQERGFRWGQIGTASLVALSHGTNDAQKTMGLITLALIGYGSWTDLDAVPTWVKLSCALAIATGTYVGGWRVIRTMGKGLVELSPPQGMAAEASSAAIVLTSSQLGMALSTTHVATGSILGTGLGSGGVVRWALARRMAAAWIITLPASAAVGAVCWLLLTAVGGVAGPLVLVAVLIALSTLLWLRAQREKVDLTNVTEDWDGELAPASARHPEE
ncbi:PiT family inorganic phosphate transporter [Isoptericola jiangsuensis]|uniref:Phosphate transporter n=1 Tax=Isoptericola jiangsuensis TaxID=548579 RepID=A0A2A9EXH8_9MICO|nr:inorganic phosphate transporter [Isoptericola jiangsuensis]PFG43266.1 PiT family inorganic phosphate transporter [Isoptericola jiangsuensis]